MSPAEILEVLQSEAPDVKWATGGDYVKEIEAVSDVFAGMNQVKRQQYVYKILNSYITDGSLHALTIRAYTPAEKADS